VPKAQAAITILCHIRNSIETIEEDSEEQGNRNLTQKKNLTNIINNERQPHTMQPNLAVQIIELAEAVGCRARLGNAKIQEECNKEESASRKTLIEIDVAIENEQGLSRLLSALSLHNIAFLASTTEIRIVNRKSSCRIIIYRKIDEKLFTVIESHPRNEVFIYLGARYNTTQGLDARWIYYKLHETIKQVADLFISKKTLKRIFKVKTYVGLSDCDWSPAFSAGHSEQAPKDTDRNADGVSTASLAEREFASPTKLTRFEEYNLNLADLLFCLEAIYDAFRRYGCEVYLSAGTLLGAVRDGMLIPWDDDADLASKEKYISSADGICADLTKQGMSVYKSDIWNTIGVYYKGVTIDIDFLRDEGDHLTIPMKNICGKLSLLLFYCEWVVCYQPMSPTFTNIKNDVWMAIARDVAFRITNLFGRNVRLRLADRIRSAARKVGSIPAVIEVPKNFVGRLKNLKVFNRDWSTPEMVEEYLTLYYGNWRIKRADFDYYDAEAKPVSRVLNMNRNWEYR
jgi:hypothetical protein